MSPVLSVIIISHNQCQQLVRCVESVIGQNIPFDYQVILSDDNSSDGTYEISKKYSQRYPHIIATQCNSDNCSPSMTSERASFNRINGLKFATGKYIIHVDADDFYIGNDSFKTMVEALEQHEECTVAIQNYRIMHESQSLNDAFMAFPKDFFNNEIISADTFIQRFEYIHNSACCVRNCQIEWSKSLLCNYDDYDISFAYLKKGRIYLVDRSDFVYCQYNCQTASKFASVDQIVCWTTEIPLILEFPRFTGSLMRRGVNSFPQLIKLALSGAQLELSTKNHLRVREQAFFIRVFLKKMYLCDVVRLHLAKLVIGYIKFFAVECNWIYKILYKLCIQWNVPNDVCFDRAN